jgi:hypothetical protein
MILYRNRVVRVFCDITELLERIIFDYFEEVFSIIVYNRVMGRTLKKIAVIFSSFLLISTCAFCSVSAQEQAPTQPTETPTSNGGCHDDSTGGADSTGSNSRDSKGAEGHLFCCDTSVLPENYARLGSIKSEFGPKVLAKHEHYKLILVEYLGSNHPVFARYPGEPINFWADLSISPNAPPSRV